MDTDTGKDIDDAPETADQQWFVDRLQEVHSQGDERLSLTNVYKELPITHPAKISDIRGTKVQFETSELQLAAISQCNEVYIQSPLLDSAVLGHVTGMDIRRHLVDVTDFAKANIKIGMRSTVRVRLKKPMAVAVEAGGEKVGGVIHDVSVGGTCIKTTNRHCLEAAGTVVIHLELQPGLLLQVESLLVHADGCEPPYKCSFRFNHTPHTEELLSAFVHQRQREILKELRETL